MEKIAIDLDKTLIDCDSFIYWIANKYFSDAISEKELHYCFVEENYVGDDAIRIEMHQSINKIKSRDQIQALINEYTDRYGQLSEDIILYMEEKYLEYLLKSTGVEKFSETENEVMFWFDEDSSSRINAKKIFELSVKLHLKYKFAYRSRKIIVRLNPKDSTKSYIYGLTKFLENLKNIIVYKE